eukprot:GHRQ01026747.1.p3 GENE.GHRQ01026747.1~~GHRQ01026747.1.p3  ORF type:complete len:156 (+),score=49.58 GHRQ01026747.1:132-599(+)
MMRQRAMRCSSSSTSRVIPYVRITPGHVFKQAHVCFATTPITTSIPSRRRRRATTYAPVADAPSRNGSSTSAGQALAGIAAQQPQGAVQFGQPPDAAVFAPANGWVVFADLHMSQKTMGVALQTLQRVHKEAADRGAGVLFLGAPCRKPAPLRTS